MVHPEWQEQSDSIVLNAFLEWVYCSLTWNKAISFWLMAISLCKDFMKMMYSYPLYGHFVNMLWETERALFVSIFIFYTFFLLCSIWWSIHQTTDLIKESTYLFGERKNTQGENSQRCFSFFRIWKGIYSQSEICLFSF